MEQQFKPDMETLFYLFNKTIYNYKSDEEKTNYQVTDLGLLELSCFFSAYIRYFGDNNKEYLKPCYYIYLRNEKYFSAVIEATDLISSEKKKAINTEQLYQNTVAFYTKYIQNPKLLNDPRDLYAIVADRLLTISKFGYPISVKKDDNLLNLGIEFFSQSVHVTIWATTMLPGIIGTIKNMHKMEMHILRKTKEKEDFFIDNPDLGVKNFTFAKVAENIRNDAFKMAIDHNFITQWKTKGTSGFLMLFNKFSSLLGQIVYLVGFISIIYFLVTSNFKMIALAAILIVTNFLSYCFFNTTKKSLLFWANFLILAQMTYFFVNLLSNPLPMPALTLVIQVLLYLGAFVAESYSKKVFKEKLLSEYSFFAKVFEDNKIYVYHKDIQKSLDEDKTTA